MFKKYNVDFCFTCLEMSGQDYGSASDPESLVHDVFDIANKNGLNFEGENAIECYHWGAYNQVLKWASKGLKEFTFLRMSDKLMNDNKIWTDFIKFIKQMHHITCDKQNVEKENFIKEEKHNEKLENNEHSYDNYLYNFI